MTVVYPDDLRPQSCSAELRNLVASGGRTGTGREQRVFRDPGFWEIAMRSIPIRGRRERVLSYRTMIARLRQGEEILVRLFDLYRAKGVPPVITTGDAALRATQISLEGVSTDLRPGHHFTINQRLYRATEIVSEDIAVIGVVLGTHDGDAWDDGDIWVDGLQSRSAIKFLPPLRAAAPAGSAIEFDDLVCLCVLKDMQDGDLELDLGRFGAPSLTFIESI